MQLIRNEATASIKMFEVGGAIRDAFLGVKSKDRDFVCIGQSFEQMREFVLLNGGEIFLETPQYFTIRAKVPNLGAADFVLGRKDGEYKDGRRPTEVFLCETIEQELARRDFTVNAMAVNVETEEFIDPFGGKRDLTNRTLRCVGNTVDRMTEDALRMLRAIRFGITKQLVFGETLESFLLNPDSADLLANVSIERIREELVKCFEFNTLATLGTLEKYWRVRAHIFSRNLSLTPKINVVS